MHLLRKIIIVMMIFSLVFGVKKVAFAEDYDFSDEEYYENNTKENDLEEISSGNSKKIIFVEVFCGLIGVVFVVMALKVNSD